MSPAEWETVARLFEEARTVAPGQRDSFLEARVTDESIRRELHALLANAADDSFLERPALGAALSGEAIAGPCTAASLAAGTRLSGCTIRRALGRGGMGYVYEADQDEPPRRVAIKTFPHDSGGLLDRIRREAAALARLRHPGIASIYAAGVERVDGVTVPYLIMELVEGARDIVTWCRQERPGRRRLLDAIAAACDAVAHGHLRGVIHRDLKPANILVDQAGAVRVIDFGVAALVETEGTHAQGKTRPGDLLGTPRYMSPEQAGAGGEGPDVRTDVYSLGVVLYELLSGRLPHDAPEDAGPLAIAAVIRESEPRRLGGFDRSLRGDTEAIVMKAVARDPRDRYQSVLDLADDVRRLTDGRAVRARRRVWWLAAAKHARRHPAPWLAGAAAAVLVVAALGVAISSLSRAASEGRTAAAVTEFLAGMLASPRVRREGHAVRVLDVLDDADGQMDRITDPDVRLALRRTLAETYEAAGDYEKSRGQFERLAQESTRRRGPDHAQTVWAKTKLAGALYDCGRFDESEALYLTLLERAERAYGAHDPRTTRLRNDLALICVDTGRLAEAEGLLTLVVDARRRDGSTRDLAQALYNLGVVHYSSGRHEAAAPFLDEALERLAAIEGRDGRDAASMRRFVAQNLLRLGRIDEAATEAAAAHQTLRRAVGEDHPDTAAAVVTVARVARARSDVAGAEVHYTEAIRAYRASLGEAHPYTSKIAAEYADWKGSR